LAVAAAAQREPRGHAVLAEIYETGAGVEANPKVAIQYYAQASQLGYDPATLGLALAHLEGKHIDRDDDKGMALLEKASKHGMPQAQYYLAIEYLKRRHEGQNELLAAKWMVASAKQDYLPATAAMGDVLLMLDPTKQAEAVAWFRKAAEKGHGVGQRKFGLALIAGDHVPLNVTAGVDWLNKSAEQGDAEAQEVLGVIYMAGLGVTRDRDRAQILLQSAADAGRDRAKVYLNVLKREAEGSGEF